MADSNLVATSNGIQAPNIDDVIYYQTEGTGTFAYAMWKYLGQPSEARFGILTDPDGHKWSDDVPFEVLHAYLMIEDQYFDVGGTRSSIIEIAEEFNAASFFETRGPYTEDEFLNHYLGTGEHYPMYMDQDDLEKCLDFIRLHSDFYGRPAQCG